MKVEEVLADGRLLRHPRRFGVEEARGPVAAKVRNENAVAGGGEGRDDAVPRPRVVGEAVEEDDGEAVGCATLLVGDLQRWACERGGAWPC